MRTVHRFFAAFVAAASLVAFPSCRVAGAIGESMPASSGYVDDLHKSQNEQIIDARKAADAQIAQAVEQALAAVSSAREEATKADAQIRTDFAGQVTSLHTELSRAEQAQQAGYAAALAEGKTHAEAMARGVLDKLDVLRQSNLTQTAAAAELAGKALTEAQASAEKARVAAVEAANERVAASEKRLAEARAQQDKDIADARKKDAERLAAAIDEFEQGGGDGTPWWAQAATAALLAGLGYTMSKKAGKASTAESIAAANHLVEKKDAAPFVGPNGELLTEEQMVAFIKSSIGKG